MPHAASPPSIYEKLKPYLEANDLIRRLGLEHVRTLGAEAYCRPLCHESESGESLQINIRTGRWNCKACQHSGRSGDLIQLVEYALNNGAAPTHGAAQKGSETHRAAVRWLCEQYGIPFDDSRISGDPALDVVHLFAMAAHENLLRSPTVLAWIEERWGFDIATIEANGIGFMPSPILPSIAAEAMRPASRAAFASSGIGWFEGSTWRTRFEGRIVFPYLEHGRAVYLIGRSTPWTPAHEGGRGTPKYHKLAVHSEQRPYISKAITNDHLFGEPVMGTDIDEIGVLEGITDAIAVQSLGLPVVSPVTISFNQVDAERFIRKCRENGIRRVWILFDNELSGSGNVAARRVGEALMRGGIAVSIVTLPLGPTQKQARDEVLRILGPERFTELERSSPLRRKEIVAEAAKDDAEAEWIRRNVNLSKIDAAEWVAQKGAAAPGAFDAVRKSAVEIVKIVVDELSRTLNVEDDPSTRASHFGEAIELAAHVEDRLARDAYAGVIANAAGKGVPKAEIVSRIGDVRRARVAPKRADEKAKAKVDHEVVSRDLVLLPPDESGGKAPSIAPPPSAPGAPSPPPPPSDAQGEHGRYSGSRESVSRAVEAKLPEEQVGEHVAQLISVSMGFTAFRTPDELYLVRGNQRVPVGVLSPTPRFRDVLYMVSGLTPAKTSHRSYIASCVYFLGRDARRADDVSWSHVSEEGEVYFPTGDRFGTILRIAPGEVVRTRMAEAKVPAVAGEKWKPFSYVEEAGGVENALHVFRWTSLSEDDRMILIYWIACLPIVRRIGVVPIVRIQGGSSSGKTRTLDAVSFLVNGSKRSSSPTAAAITSRLSTDMLTLDDNRETKNVSPGFLDTLLQATHLGAKEKRKANSDTETVEERICGALIMNGIEPIHDGKSEIASRFLTLICDAGFRAPDSPRSEGPLLRAILSIRDAFWSDAARRCSEALVLDAQYGEALGEQIEEVFGETKIGRLSAFLRIIYLAWVAGRPESDERDILGELAPEWRRAFGAVGKLALDSLIAEELTVTALRYAFAYGRQVCEASPGDPTTRQAWHGAYVLDVARGEAYLGPMRATRLARIVREAGKQINGPGSITYELRAGQLERRLLDGRGFVEAAGFDLQVEATANGRIRFAFRLGPDAPQPQVAPPDGGYL